MKFSESEDNDELWLAAILIGLGILIGYGWRE